MVQYYLDLTERPTHKLDKTTVTRFIRLGRAHVRGLFTLRTRATIERYALVLGEGSEAFDLDVLEMHEQVGTACVGSDEAEAFGFTEPFDDAGLRSHDKTS